MIAVIGRLSERRYVDPLICVEQILREKAQREILSLREELVSVRRTLEQELHAERQRAQQTIAVLQSEQEVFPGVVRS